LIKVLVSLLMVVIGINVAMLVFARTAGRMGEIAVRTALGASRARIVAQLFAEAFVLSMISTVIGLVMAALALRYLGASIDRIYGAFLPYWLNFGLSWGMVLYGFGMALLAAFVVGVIPALKATGSAVRSNLQSLGGGGGIRLGRSWTVMIVGQVAVAVALLPVVVHVAIVKPTLERVDGPAFDTSEWVTTHLLLDREQPIGSRVTNDSLFRRTFDARAHELINKLNAESSVADVVPLSSVPGAERVVSIHTDSLLPRASSFSELPASAAVHNVGSTLVDPSFFRAFGIPVLAGRSLETRDAGVNGGAASSIVVNQPFVQLVFGGGNAIGRRVRVAAVNDQQVGEWLEIVGVVPNFPSTKGTPTSHPVMYQALPSEIAQPIVMAVRARGVPPASLTGRLREVALSIDPMMRLEDVRALDKAESLEAVLDRMIYSGVMLVTLSIVLLSAAGIYALMSFTIARRRREIGIRAALGAGARQIVSSVLKRAARQVGLGIVIGLSLASLLMQTDSSWRWNVGGLVSLGSVAVFMALVGLAAAWGPAREALRIQPSEALRSE
jgi:cell division protein FtsX